MNNAKANEDRATDTDANVEPNAGDAAFREDQVATFDSPVRIHFHHTRKRLADPDGVSVKAAIDGLVEAGVLTDDSAKQVAEVTHRQSKGDPERTEIVIEEVE